MDLGGCALEERKGICFPFSELDDLQKLHSGRVIVLALGGDGTHSWVANALWAFKNVPLDFSHPSL